jgi:hypothetical protein
MNIGILLLGIAFPPFANALSKLVQNQHVDLAIFTEFQSDTIRSRRFAQSRHGKFSAAQPNQAHQMALKQISKYE